MKRNLILAVFLAATSPAFAQQPDQAAAMKAWQDYMTPGKSHEMLARSNGTWITETTLWMDPSAPPQKSMGTCTNRMILGGRYQESDFRGKFMDQPFEGKGMVAFDNAKQAYISTWVDNMGTGVMSLEGKWDDAARTLYLTGKCVDPSSGKEMPVREEFTVADDDHHKMTMYMTGPDGKEMKTMEVAFSRAGKKK